MDNPVTFQVGNSDDDHRQIFLFMSSDILGWPNPSNWQPWAKPKQHQRKFAMPLNDRNIFHIFPPFDFSLWHALAPPRENTRHGRLAFPLLIINFQPLAWWATTCPHHPEHEYSSREPQKLPRHLCVSCLNGHTSRKRNSHPHP